MPGTFLIYSTSPVTLHAPHGGRDMDKGAVAMVIRKIEEADLVQQVEREKENKEQKDVR
jgi:hypothetical protein